jgi:tetratricopeptide (TPR) repeat protein
VPNEPAGWTSTCKAIAKLTGLGVIAYLSPDPATAVATTAMLGPVVEKAVEIFSEGVGEGAGALTGEALAERAVSSKLPVVLDRAEAAFHQQLEAQSSVSDVGLILDQLPLYDHGELRLLLSRLGEELEIGGVDAAVRARLLEISPRLGPALADQIAHRYRSCLMQSVAVTFGDGNRFQGLVSAAILRDVTDIRGAVEQARSALGELVGLARGIEATTREIRDDVTQVRETQLDHGALLRGIDQRTRRPEARRSWRRPEPPSRLEPLVGRDADLGRSEIESILARLTPVAGQPGLATARFGMPGVGKTLLVQHAAARLYAVYPGGVLFTTVEDGSTESILRAWARRAYDAGVLPDDFEASAENVRVLLEGHGPILVVLDGVRTWGAAEALLEALPDEVRILLTTQDAGVARRLDPQAQEIGTLTDVGALRLLRSVASGAAEQDAPLLGRLAQSLGNHPLALRIAGGSLDSLGRDEWPSVVERIGYEVREGRAFADLGQPPDDEQDQRVAATLRVAYDALDPTTRARFRDLGAFAPAGTFSSEAIARVWGCTRDEALVVLNNMSRRGLVIRVADSGTSRWRQHSLVRWYALALLVEAGDDDSARREHGKAYLSLLDFAASRHADHEMLTDYGQIAHGFDWSIDHDLVLAGALADRSVNLQERFGQEEDSFDWASRLLTKATSLQDGEFAARFHIALAQALVRLSPTGGREPRERLHDALKALDKASQFFTPETAPPVHAAIQNIRGTAFSHLAGLIGENRVTRLREALTAYDAALQVDTPEAAPFNYATVQNNRGTVLIELANVGDEDRAERLREALAAYDAALCYHTPEAAPLDHAMVQNNRGNVLVDLANLGEEDQEARLREALTAYDAALCYHTPETAPRAYGLAQSNRGNVLAGLANFDDEDRDARLREALAAYDAALQVFPLDATPFDHAMVQNNRASALRELPCVSDEDERTQLREVLAAYDVALRVYTPVSAPIDHAMVQNNRGIVLRDLAGCEGEDRPARLRVASAAYDAALRIYTHEVAPLDHAMTQSNRTVVLGELASLEGEDRAARLREALAACNDALRIYTVGVAPLDHAMAQNNRANVLRDLASLEGEDRSARLQEAFKCGLVAFSLYDSLNHSRNVQITVNSLRRTRDLAGRDFPSVWRAVADGEPPAWLS